MKKQLLCTSAIALGVAAAPASAQDWNLDWGGFFNQHVGYADVSSDVFPGADLDGVTVHTNAEIIFTPSITLDNGLTFGINVQMEALNAGGGVDGIDESFMSISSDSFGRLDVGYENSAGYKSMVGAPSVHSMFINSPSISTYIPLSSILPFNFRQAGISTFTEVGGNNDVARITYYTPSFNGLTIGVSYAPTGAFNAQNSFGVNRNAVLSDIFDIGVNYSQSFGAADVSFGARYGTGNAPTGLSDPDTWGVGASVGFSGFTIGGSYTENDNGLAGGFNDQSGWSLGVSYDAAGPWAFSLETYQGDFDNTGAAGGDEEYAAYALAASRDLGPGVNWDIYVIYAEGQDDGVGGAGEVDGTVIGTAINLSF